MQLYSDMQQSGMPANFNDLRLNEDIRLEAHPVAAAETPNFAVENVVAPRRVYDSRKNARAGHRGRLRHQEGLPHRCPCCSTIA